MKRKNEKMGFNYSAAKAAKEPSTLRPYATRNVANL